MNDTQKTFLYRSISWALYFWIFLVFQQSSGYDSFFWKFDDPNPLFDKLSVSLFAASFSVIILNEYLYKSSSLYYKSKNILVSSIPLFFSIFHMIISFIRGDYLGVDFDIFESGYSNLLSLVFLASSVFYFFFSDFGYTGRRKYIFRIICWPLNSIISLALLSPLLNNFVKGFIYEGEEWGTYHIYSDPNFIDSLLIITFFCTFSFLAYFFIYYKSGIYEHIFNIYFVVIFSVPAAFSLLTALVSIYTADSMGKTIVSIIPSDGNDQIHLSYPMVIAFASWWYAGFRKMGGEDKEKHPGQDESDHPRKSDDGSIT